MGIGIIKSAPEDVKFVQLIYAQVLSGVLTIITKDLSNYCADQLLKIGIGIAAVIIALGVYTKLTKEGKERFTRR